MKKLGMWAVVAFVGFLIGKLAQSENKSVNNVLQDQVK